MTWQVRLDGRYHAVDHSTALFELRERVIITAGEYADEGQPDVLIDVVHALDDHGNDCRGFLARAIAKALEADNQPSASTRYYQDTSRVLDDITDERERQVDKGWTREHDDRHTTYDLVGLAVNRILRPRSVSADPHVLASTLTYSRQQLIEGIAMLVAAVEAIDRREARR